MGIWGKGRKVGGNFYKKKVSLIDKFKHITEKVSV